MSAHNIGGGVGVGVGVNVGVGVGVGVATHTGSFGMIIQVVPVVQLTLL